MNIAEFYDLQEDIARLFDKALGDTVKNLEPITKCIEQVTKDIKNRPKESK